MSDDDIGDALRRTIEGRVRAISPRPNVEAFLARVDRRSARQRRRLAAALVAMIAVGTTVGFMVGRLGSDGTDRHIVLAPSAGLPPADAGAGDLEPADVEAARAAVTKAFHDAYDGSNPAAVKTAAIQYGDQLEAARRLVISAALRRGYSAEELAGSSIQVLDVRFIDSSHAVVRFTITVPGHGDVLVDRVGIAVLDGGSWKVSLRTACDLLSLNGLLKPCPS